MMIELTVAIALMGGALLPLAYSIATERKFALATYQRAVAMEIVDGEMEILLAGDPRSLPAGTQVYSVNAAAAKNLPPGQFLLTSAPGKLRLEWKPAVKNHGGSAVREVTLK